MNIFTFKKIVLVVFAGISLLQLRAQSISNYTFSTNNTSSLKRSFGSLVDDIDMSFGTEVNVLGSASNLAGASDTIPFDFWVNGTRCTRFNATSNGWVGLGAAFANAATSNTFPSNLGIRIAPFATTTATMGTSANGRVHHKVFGSQPNRVFVIEFMNMVIPTAGPTNDSNTFQVRLYENNGAIEFVYGRMTNSGGSAISFNAGFSFTSSSYQNVNITTHTSSTSSSSPNIAAASSDITNICGRVEGSQRSYMWLPTPVTDPGTITFSSITTSAMTLNWTDATGEIGYAIYRSTDGGATYTFVNTVVANLTSFIATGLTANTTYDWRVYSVRESISDPGDGTASTLPPSKFITAATGNWSDPATWVGGVVPSSQDSAEITAGHTVTIDFTGQACGTLLINGTLTYANSFTSITFTVNGDVFVNATGTFTAGTGAVTHVLNIGGNSTASNLNGNLVVNGSLDFETTALVNTVFWGTGNATVTGTGITCELPFLTVTKGGVSPFNVNNTLEILRVFTQPNTAPFSATQRLSATSGTLKISSAVNLASLYNTTVNLASSAAARFWLNNSSAVIGMSPSATGGTLFIQGELKIDAGELTVGVGSQNHQTSATGVININGGALTLLGGLTINNAAASQLNITNGRLILDPQGTTNLSAFNSCLNIQASSTFSMSNGTIEVNDPHASAGGNSITIAVGGVKSITGGTIIIGNSTTAPSGGTLAGNSGFGLNIGIPINNLTFKNDVSVNQSRMARLTANLTVNGTLTLDANSYLVTASSGVGFILTATGNVANSGTIAGVTPGTTTAPGAGSMVISGTTLQTVSGTGGASLLTLKTSNPSGVSFTTTGVWALERITLENGSVTNTSSNIQVGSSTYSGTIAIGGLNESTSAGSFSTIPNLVTTFGNLSYVYGPSSASLQTGSYNEMAAGAQTLTTLTLNDAQGLVVNRNIDVRGTLNLTAGNLDMGTNALTLGVSAAAPGVLTRTSGFVKLATNGSFRRWYSTTSNLAFDYASGFPLTTTNGERSLLFSLNSGFLTTGGNITVKHTNTTGFTDITAFTDGALSIDRRSNSFWNLSSTSTPNVGLNTLSMRLICEGIGAVLSVPELRVTKSSSAAGGTTQIGSGTTSRPEINRDFTAANISGGALFDDFYLGTNSGVNPLSPTIIAIATGDWNQGATWQGGIVPTISNSATIQAGVNVTIPASYTANCNGIYVAPGATLTASNGTINSLSSLTIDGTVNNSGTSFNITTSANSGITINNGGTLSVSGGTINVGNAGGGNNRVTVASGGTLTVSGGTLNVNGNVVISSGGALNQTAGDINIDANSGTAGTSTIQGTHIFQINSTSINCSGGNITIVDPPHSSITAGTTNALRISVSTGSITAFTGTHTFRFGDGVSTTAGNTNGFNINTKSSTGVVPLQNVTVNGGNTTGRWVSTSYTAGTGTHIKGNLVINTGSEYRHTVTSPFAVGGDITNDGILTVSQTLTLGGSGYIISNAQAISGTGTFRNATSSPTAEFTNVTLDNGSTLTLNTTANNYRISGTLNIGSLKIITNGNSVVIPSGATFTRTTGYIVGNLGKFVSSGSNVNRTFEIGSATDYLPVTVTYPSVTTSGTVTLGISAGDHPQIGTSCLNTSKTVNRNWSLSQSGLVSTGGNYTFNFLLGDVDPSTVLASAKIFSYDGSSWQAGLTPSGTTATSFSVSGLNDYGGLAIGEITPLPTSVTISTSTTTICTGTNVTFNANIVNGGSNPTYNWKVNGGSVSTASSYSSSSLVNGDQVTLDIVSNSPCVAVTNATSNTLVFTVNPLSVGGAVTANQTVCSGSNASALNLSGQTGAVTKWQSANNPGFTGATDIPATAGLTSYTPTAVVANTYYRAVVQSGVCASADATAALISVDVASVGGTVSSNQTICSGGIVSALNLTGQTGSVTKWQSATNAAFTGASDIGGTAGLTSYTPSGVTSNTYYRAVVQNGVCPVANSASALITASPLSVGGTVSSSQTICSGGTVAALNLSGQTGTVVNWQSASDLAFTTPTNISGTAGLTSYTPTGVTSNTYYRAVVQSGTCAIANSASVLITVTPSTVGGSVTSDQTICSGGSVTTLNLAGHLGSIVNWQSANNPSFTGATNISGTAGLTGYTPTGVTATTYYRAVIQNGICPVANSSSATITVDPPSVGGTVSSNQTICSGGTIAALNLSGQTGTVTKWQSANNVGFTGATDIPATAGLTSYTPTGVTSNTYYRAVVQSGLCTPSNSAAALITVDGPSVGGAVTSDQTICSGGTVSALNLAGQTGTVTKWQSANNVGFTGATDIPATAGLTSYTPTGVTSNTYYRAVVQNGSCAVANSSASLITVNSASVGGNVSSDQSICTGGTVSALTSSGRNGSVVNWQSANNPAFTGATNISGTAGLSSYTPTGVTATTYYRVVVQNGVCAIANSSSATITVSPSSVGGTVSSDQSICSGSTVAALNLTGQTGLVTTWQSSTDAGFTTPTNIPATAGLTSYTPTGVTSNTYYRAVVQSGACGVANSASVLITVSGATVAGTVSSDQTICSGGTVSALNLAGQTGTVTKWQSATNVGFAGATDIPATAGLTSYTPTGVTSNTYYRAVVQSGSCASANTNGVLITVNPTSVGGTVSSDQSICSGGTVAALNLTGQTGLVTTWQSSTDAGFTTPTNIPATAGLTSYTPTGVTSNTYYRAVVQSGACGVANSASVLITVSGATVAGTVSSDQTICSGGTVSALNLAGQTGTVTKWQSATNVGFTGATDIPATAGLTSYTPTGVTSNTYYRAVVQSGSCASANTNGVLITVNPTSVGGTVSSNQTICSGGTVSALNLTGQTGLVTKWQSATNPAFTGATDIPATAGLTSFTPTGLLVTTYFRAVVQSGSCATANSASATITVNAGSVGGSVNGSSPVCSGSSTNLNLTGQTGLVTKWQSAIAPFSTFNDIANTSTTLNTGVITQTTRYRAVVANGSCASANSSEFEVEVTSSGVWVGVINQNWNNAANWCGGVPTATTDVVISSGTPFTPLINTAALTRNLTVNLGASLAFTGVGNSIDIKGNMLINGTFNASGGTVSLSSATAQNVAGLTYNTLEIKGGGEKVLTSAATVTGSLAFTSGKVNLTTAGLTINATATLTGNNSSNYFITGNSAGLTRKSIGAVGVTFPVGTSASYLPVVISNSGTTDDFTISVADNVYNAYVGNAGSGLPISANVVDKTFYINEAVAGGSTCNITFTWNGSNELTMDRTKTIVGRYTGGIWSNISGTSSAASGPNPYSFTASGVTSFGIFGVGDENSPLPVKLIAFNAKLNDGITKLRWATASEINSTKFDVERGVDGYNFTKIAEVKASGNTSTRTDYKYDDAGVNAVLAKSNMVYYRLKFTNLDGKYEYSQIVSVSEFNNMVFDVLNAVPNPFNNQTAISVRTSALSDINVKVIDALGIEHYNEFITPVLGANKVEIKAAESWKTGVYYVHITQDENTKVVKIIKR